MFHKIRMFNNDYDSSDTLDSVHSSPRVYRHGKLVTTSRFDTVLIYVKDGQDHAQLWTVSGLGFLS
jgi:hypothetical protein